MKGINMAEAKVEGVYVQGPDWLSRVIVLVSFLILVPAIAAVAGLLLGIAFFDEGVMVKLLTSGSAVAGLGFAAAMVEEYFIIRNDTTGMFVTIDQLRSFLGRAQIHWYYGPGTHLCFPWERRIAENNISLKEATENLEFTLQLSDGTLKLTGSFRLSPDLNNPVRLLRGAAVVAKDIEDRVVAKAAEHFDKKSLMEAMSGRKELNDALNKSGIYSDFNDRFGVTISDVTISQLLPSEEVQRTISARTEAETIANGTALLLGFSNKEEMNAAMKAKVISTEDISRARDRFLAVSGNMEGMNLDRKEISLSLAGLDPAVIQALTQLLQMPGVQAAAAAYAAKTGTNQSSGGQSNRGNRGGKRPNRGSGKPNQPAST